MIFNKPFVLLKNFSKFKFLVFKLLKVYFNSINFAKSDSILKFSKFITIIFRINILSNYFILFS